ncbi:MAG TPA: 2-oxoglutarate dehydrogenase, E2 component, dihydrolipoamide succinyltransferase, partial [Mycobacteriales bacterium]|nr:2-oxoglutarate dehydrogenase, E2 component, dihydrolipoamide succinyltransferase [Mycobacteriales bacterium]
AAEAEKPAAEAEKPAAEAEKPAAEAEKPAAEAEKPAAEAEKPAAEEKPAAAAEPEPEPEPAAEAEPEPAAPDEPAGEVGAYVTPLVRKLAAEHGVDLEQLSGTGVGGRIRKQDVLDAARPGGAAVPGRKAEPAEPRPAAATRPSSPAPVARGRTEKLSRLRQVIAARMTESLQTSAQLTTVVEADLTRVARLRDAAKADFEAREGVKLTFLPFFATATCAALKEYPQVNASIDLEGGTVTYHEGVHLGIAVDTDRGLLVPVIHDAGDLNLGGLARNIADLAARTRENKVSPDELGGGTFTLTNTGSRGALFDTPIINQPQVGILGTGTVVRRPVVVEDPEYGAVVAIRHMVYLALTYDHRLVDGADAARMLTAVKERLEAGEFEGELGL